jgi:hypothetical protein
MAQRFEPGSALDTNGFFAAASCKARVSAHNAVSARIHGGSRDVCLCGVRLILNVLNACRANMWYPWRAWLLQTNESLCCSANVGWWWWWWW